MLIFIAVVIIIILIDYTRLKRTRPSRKIVAVYTVVMAVSLVLGILISIEKRPVSPAKVIEAIFRSTGVVK